MKTYNTIKTTTPGTALETIPGLEVPALPEKIAKIDQAGSNEFQMKLGSSFLKFREALILALRDPMSLGLGGGEATTGATSVIPISWIVESSALKVMTNLERNKLAGIENGAQVNTVTSVQGRVGGVVVGAADLGLGNVDNTSDVNKPVSTAQATAINARIPKLGYVGVSMNGASLTADIGKMYGVYATGVTITLPSATTVGDGEVIGFMIGVNAGRTLQINTTSSQDLITPEGVKTTGYAVTGFARTIYAVCYFHTWMLCGMEDSAIAAATSSMMTALSTKLDMTGLSAGGSSITAQLSKTYNFIGPGTLNLPAANSSVPDGSYVEVFCQTALYTITIASTSLIISRLGTGSKTLTLSGLGRSIRFVKMLSYWFALSDSQAGNVQRWSYNYTVASKITGVPWRLQGFGASSTMTVPLASSVEDGTQIGALITTGGGTVTLQRSGTDQFVTPTGLESSYVLRGNGNSIVLVKVTNTTWACLSSPDAQINVAMAGVKQSLPTTKVLSITADNTVFMESDALAFSVFDKPVEVNFGGRCIGSVALDLSIELFNTGTSTSTVLYSESSIFTTPFSIGAKVVKNGSNFDVLLTRLHDGYSAVILPNVVAVSSGTYKIRCICSVGSEGGTVNIFSPEIVITR